MKKIFIILTLVLFTVTLIGCQNSEEHKEISDKRYNLVQSNENEKVSEAYEKDALDIILSRKTARSFSKKAIADEDIQKLLTAGMAAPTSGNQKAWEFIVVKDKSTLKDIQNSHPYASALSTAPITIVVAGDTKNATYPENLIQDTSAAAQNIIIEATSLGLSSNIMSIYPQEDRMKGVQKALKLPEYVQPSLMISIGYNEETTSGSSTSFYSSEKVHFDNWNKK